MEGTVDEEGVMPLHASGLHHHGYVEYVPMSHAVDVVDRLYAWPSIVHIPARKQVA